MGLFGSRYLGKLSSKIDRLAGWEIEKSLEKVLGGVRNLNFDFVGGYEFLKMKRKV